jgi:hypothetical protein
MPPPKSFQVRRDAPFFSRLKTIHQTGKQYINAEETSGKVVNSDLMARKRK